MLPLELCYPREPRYRVGLTGNILSLFELSVFFSSGTQIGLALRIAA